MEPVAWAFVFMWLYNHTQSILLHGGINAAAASLLVPATAVEGSVYLKAALTGNVVVILSAVAVVVLTRGRLGR